ncbi:MAG TPA: hypothetical protein VEB65_07460 [Solirubrobacterales bacterium]|nr:hypothetical protein [Solirubrobacterales bacterium]
MAEPPLATLARWEDSGALWRTRSLGDEEAVVELCTCHGEVVELLRSGDRELLRYLKTRRSSEAPPSPN